LERRFLSPFERTGRFRDRFRISLDDAGRITWLGHTNGKSQILDDPLNTPEGATLPVVRGDGSFDLVVLAAAAFKPHGPLGSLEDGVF
jgi:hypothetical protein